MTQGSYQTLDERNDAQVAFLKNGKPLEAFDPFFGRHVKMFANNELFASGAEEGRRKQEPYINAAVTITGQIVDVGIDEDQNLTVFRNLSRFTTTDGTTHKINGLSWQRWEGDYIAEERYYDGEMMQKLISEGVLENPGMLLGHGNQ